MSAESAPGDGRQVRLATGAGPDLLAWWHDREPPATTSSSDTAPPAHGVAVLAPGVAVPARLLRGWARSLAASGWDVLRIEFPGVGESPVPPAEVPGGMDAWATRDLDTALRAAADRAGERPVVLVGHSAGAWLVLLARRADRVAAVLGISSMSGEVRHLRRRARPLLWAAVTIGVPLLTRLTGGCWGGPASARTPPVARFASGPGGAAGAGSC